MKNKKLVKVLKKYSYMFLLIVSALLIAPTYGFTHYQEQKKEQEQLELENQLIQDMLQQQQQEQQQQQDDVIANSGHNKKPETGHVDKKEPEKKPEPTPGPEEETKPDEENHTGNSGNTGGTSSGTTSGELCMDVIRTGPTERTLFIGDSRTIGIFLYSHLSNIDFYAVEGVSVYGIWDKPSDIEISGLGKVDLATVLQNGEYANIHVLLGINELGSPLDTTAQTYGKFIDDIRSYQPNARVYIAANIHVSQAKSDSHQVFNNGRINYLNNELKKFADNNKVFYLDANVLFDDANGHLNGDYTSDGVHLRAKYYIPWGQWLMEQFELLK